MRECHAAGRLAREREGERERERERARERDRARERQQVTSPYLARAAPACARQRARRRHGQRREVREVRPGEFGELEDCFVEGYARVERESERHRKVRLRIWGFGVRGSGFGVRANVSGLRLKDAVSGFGVEVSGFGVEVSGFGVRLQGWGSSVRV